MGVKYSIVMPVFLREAKHKRVVLQTLDSIKNSSADYELIIIDDGSTSKTTFLDDYADVVVRRKNKGISASWNDGMSKATAEYVVIINDDITVPIMWLQELSSAFNDAKVGVSAPQLGGMKVQPKRHPMTPVTYSHTFYPGYCFMLKKDRFYEPFDEQFKTNCGDVDYWHRIRDAGLECARVGLDIYHQEGGVLHSMGYDALSKKSLELFADKWGFNPQGIYYS